MSFQPLEVFMEWLDSFVVVNVSINSKFKKFIQEATVREQLSLHAQTKIPEGSAVDVKIALHTKTDPQPLVNVAEAYVKDEGITYHFTVEELAQRHSIKPSEVKEVQGHIEYEGQTYASHTTKILPRVTDAYFAKKIYKRSSELSEKTHLYEMNTTRKTAFEKNERVIEIIAHNTTQELYCQADEITTQLDAIPLQSGYIMQGTPVDVQIYTKNTTPVGNVEYKFKHTNLAIHQRDRGAIAKQIQRNIRQALYVDKKDVEKALDATPNKKFAAGDTLHNIAVSYNNTPIGTTHYTFKHNNDLTYKPSQARKETIEYIVKTVNAKYPKRYETTYEKVDEILPEQSNGKEKGDRRTKLDVPLYKIEEKYEKITSAGLQEKVYIILKTEAPLGYKHTVKIYEKEPLLTDAQRSLPLSNIKQCLAASQQENYIIEARSFGDGEARGELVFNPNSETLLKEWREKLKAKEGHKQITDKLYLKVDDKDVFLKGDEFELRAFGCYCGRDFTVDEMKNIVKELRGSEGITSVALFSDLRSPLQKSDRTYERFTEELNKAFKKYNINTCLRKAHFLAQAYHETDRFRTTQEYSSGKQYNPGQHPDAKNYGNTKLGDGPKYKGRGLMQLTWKNNYLRYKEFSKFDCIVDYKSISIKLKYSIDSAGWFWVYGSAWGNMNVKADKDDIYYINIGINGGANGFKQRINYIKKIFSIMNLRDCCKIDLSKDLGVYKLSTSEMKNTKYVKYKNAEGVQIRKIKLESYDD